MPAGRKLLQRDNNSGSIVANTRQRASNSAVDSANVNQANANQNAQAAGNRAAAANSVTVSQRNGESVNIATSPCLGHQGCMLCKMIRPDEHVCASSMKL